MALGIPIHGPNGEIAGVGMASSVGGIDQDKITLSKIRSLTYQFHFAYSELAKETENVNEIYLTKREKEILYWCSEGKSNNDIAAFLGISNHVIKFHLNNIFSKLNANDRVLAVVKALRFGLITPSYVKIINPF